MLVAAVRFILNVQVTRQILLHVADTESLAGTLTLAEQKGFTTA
jgi:hypothetical protein